MIITTQKLSPEFQTFKQELLTDIKNLLMNNNSGENREWLKSSEVRKMLGISPSTLYNLKKQKTLIPSKINGTYYYAHEDVIRILNEGRTQK